MKDKVHSFSSPSLLCLIALFALSFFPPHFYLWAQTKRESYTFEHSDCKIRLRNKVKELKRDSSEREEMETLSKIVKEKLEKRHFKISPFIDNKRVLEKDLYFTWNRKFHGLLYKQCEISVELRQSKGQFPQKKDKILYEKQVIRRVPRLTFRGMERCQLALKEAFIHIPTCKAIGYYREKK